MLLDFSLSPRAEANLAEIDRWKEQIDRQRPLARSWVGRLRRDLEAEAVAASTRLEGVPVTVDEVRRILIGDEPKQVSPGDVALVRGYRDAMTFVTRRADDPHFEWNRELLVGVHDRVLAGRFDSGAGRLRTSNNWIASREAGQTLFRTPPPEVVPELVDQCCEKMRLLKTHPAVKAAWFHIAFAAIHPFADGNGRAARVLASLAMYRGGFRSQVFTSLEEWWERHPDAYYDAFKCLGLSFDPAANVSSFVDAHVAAQLSQIRALDLRERTMRGLWIAMENVLDDRKLPKRVSHALWDAFFGRAVTRSSYLGYTDVSPAAATNDLRAATAAFLLTAIGERRGRHYMAGQILFQDIGRELNAEVQVEAAESARNTIVTTLAERLSRPSPTETALF